MKKKIIVVLVILVSFILSGVCLSFLEFRINKDKTTETIQEEKILVEDKIDLGALVPTFEDFRIEVVEKFSRTLCQYDGQIFY